MNIFRRAPFTVAYIPGRLNHPDHSLTLIVKGTFDLGPNAVASIAAEQRLPTGDEPYPDDDEGTGSTRYESDFAYFKPKADLLLVGTCHAPDGRPTPRCEVTFGVGGLRKTLLVFGNRRWERQGLSWRPTDPVPFTEMDLRYEGSFGGETFDDNPVGSGGHRVADEHGEERHPLPNLEDPRVPIDSRRDRPEPAGFGPLGRTWKTRRSKMGTYKGKYLKTRWPWFPKDFDWSHFNAAAEDMQVEGYLRGDEELYFEHLHPAHPRYESRLPALRVRCFVHQLAAGAEEPAFTEVPMNLDTLWVDMEAEQLVLVWRGWTAVASEDAEDVLDAFVLSEPLAQPPATLDACHGMFLDARIEEAKQFASPEDEEPEEAPAAGETPGSPAPEPAAPLDAAFLGAQVAAVLAQLGIDPGEMPPAAREQQQRILADLAQPNPITKLEARERDADARLRGAFSKLKLEPDKPPPLSGKAKAEQLRLIKAMGVDPAVVMTDPDFVQSMALMGAVLPQIGVDPEDLTPLIQHVKPVETRGEAAPEPSDDVPPMTRDMVMERAARGEAFAAENLSGLDLSELDLSGLDFSEANLSGTTLRSTNLQAAVLTSANLAGADLTGANLSGANATQADLASASLDGASLPDADLSYAHLAQASLVGVTMTGAMLENALAARACWDRADLTDVMFVGADLTGCRFHAAVCAGTDFSNAVLDQADFRQADLAAASVEGASGRAVSMVEANLTDLRASGCAFGGGSFRRIQGSGSIWDDADLDQADFRGARMPGALFTGARLPRANLTAADMPGTRFQKAVLAGSQMVQVNLFRGSVERADLTGADLSGANLYEVEFLDARMDDTLTTGANLRMTKLEGA